MSRYLPLLIEIIVVCLLAAGCGQPLQLSNSDSGLSGTDGAGASGSGSTLGGGGNGGNGSTLTTTPGDGTAALACTMAVSNLKYNAATVTLNWTGTQTVASASIDNTSQSLPASGNSIVYIEPKMTAGAAVANGSVTNTAGQVVTCASASYTVPSITNVVVSFMQDTSDAKVSMTSTSMTVSSSHGFFVYDIKILVVLDNGTQYVDFTETSPLANSNSVTYTTPMGQYLVGAITEIQNTIASLATVTTVAPILATGTPGAVSSTINRDTSKSDISLSSSSTAVSIEVKDPTNSASYYQFALCKTSPCTYQ